MKEQRLKFGIETILQPEFGNPGASSPETSSSYTSSPPNSVNTSPTSMAMAGLMASCSSAISDNRSIYPAWVFCTRYSDRPSSVSGARIRKPRKRDSNSDEEKRPRTAFTSEQLERLKKQFLDNRYLTEKRRQELAHELGLNESQIKIWFQNKRAKLKKSSTGERAQILFK